MLLIYLHTYLSCVWCTERLQCDVLSHSATYSKLVCLLANAANHCLTQLPAQGIGTQPDTPALGL